MAKLKNEIEQLLYSLYGSKKLTNKLYESLICISYENNLETIFRNIGNSKTSEPQRFRQDLTDKLDLKDPKKTWLQPI